MAYSRTTWEDSPSTNTPISAANLNNIEEGILDVESELSYVAGTVTTVSNSVTAIAGSVTNAQGSVTATQGSVVTHAAATTSVHGITDTSNLVYTNNATLGSVSLIAGTVSDLSTDERFNPTGAVLSFAGTAAPSGYLLCDGSAVDRTTYSDLYSTIGTAYGNGNGSTTFNVPDLSTRMPIGTGNGRTEGDSGGEENVTLTTNQMPQHTHSVTDPGHGHTMTINYTTTSSAGGATSLQGASTSPNSAFPGQSVDSNTTGISLGNAGGTASHNNMQPYLVMNYIIKT
jgi:microcystin-dependent protein